MKELFDGASPFDTPKPVRLMRRLLETFGRSGLVMDFFAGSSTFAHAVLGYNAAVNAGMKFIQVQWPEELKRQNELAGKFSTIAELSRERIRRAGKKIVEGDCHPDWNKDVGFRVLKVDASNMKEVYYQPDAVSQGSLLDAVDNIKEDRTPEDLLFQVLIDWGVDLTLPIRRQTVQGKTVFLVNEKPCDLVACFDTGITEKLIKELAGYAPLRVVFRDHGFASDTVKINAEQIFRQLSPGTDVRSI